MSAVEDLVGDIQSQLAKNGLYQIMDEIRLAMNEVQETRDYVLQVYEQDFRYDNVSPVSRHLRAAHFELETLMRSIGPADEALNEAVFRLRNA